MTGRLDGTVALVTGASSGIGRATARLLAADGAAVALLARRRERLEELAEEIGAEFGAGASVHEVDLADVDAAQRAVADVVAHHGHLGILVNNAGYGSLEPALGADVDDWWATIRINVDGVLATTHAALPHLVEAAGGSRGVADVVTVGSDAGRRVTAVGAVYSATKHAVGAFSGSLRQELAPHHVRVGIVEPGMTRTELPDKGAGDGPDLSALGEMGLMEASDIADAIAWMVTRPPRVAVNEMLVRPTEQR